MSVLINESYANPSLALWSPNVPSVLNKKALPSTLTSGSVALTGGVTSIATISFDNSYNEATAEGYLYFPSISVSGGGATAINVWIAKSGFAPLNPSQSVSYVSGSITNGSPLVVDLSKLRFCNAGNFSSLVLYIQSTGGNGQCTISNSIFCPETYWSGTASNSSISSVGSTSGVSAVSSFVTAWNIS